MKTFKEFCESYLGESLQIVYHATPLDGLYSILKSDRLELVPNIMNVEKDLGGKDKFYYLSTMRNKSGKYFLGSDKNAKTPRVETYLTLDFDYLKSKMKSLPVDYWGSGRKYSEEEERFWSNDPMLTGLKKFVKSIHVLVPKDSSEKELEKFHQLKFMADKRGIKIHFYDNPQNYVVGKNDIELKGEMDGYISLSDHGIKNFKSILSLVNSEKLNGDDSKYLRNLYYYKDYVGALNDNVGAIENFLHRSMKTDHQESRELGRKFIDAMKKFKKRDVKSFFEDVVLPKIKEKFGIDY
jgi:hypothetical protein